MGLVRFREFRVSGALRFRFLGLGVWGLFFALGLSVFGSLSGYQKGVL